MNPIAQANDGAFGLASVICTRDRARAWRVARALGAGPVRIDTSEQRSIATPFGSFQDSGLGRGEGIGGRRLHQRAKGISISSSSHTKPDVDPATDFAAPSSMVAKVPPVLVVRPTLKVRTLDPCGRRVRAHPGKVACAHRRLLAPRGI